MKLPAGLGLMVMGVVGVARGAAGQSAHQPQVVAHTPHIAALLGAFLFVGGLMLIAKRDAFTKDPFTARESSRSRSTSDRPRGSAGK